MALFKKTNKKLSVKKELSLLTFFTKKKELNINYDSVSEGMYKYYKELLYPLEEAYLFHQLISPKLTEQDFVAKPMVLVIGEYSTGKTTFINNLINLPKGYPKCKIGDEPTTEEFVILTKGTRSEPVEVPGQVLMDDKTKAFSGLKQFGRDFANSFKCFEMSKDLAIFDHLTIVDTPGLMNSKKYDMNDILKFFCEQVDIIILLFDFKRINISDEIGKLLKVLTPYLSKLKICLNKADQFNSTNVGFRVFGSFMWSLRQHVKTPIPPTIYIVALGRASECEELQNIIEKDNNRLKTEIQKVKANAAMHKLDSLISRINKANVLAKIIARLKKAGAKKVFEKKYNETRTATILEAVFEELQSNYNLAKCDFPNAEEFRDAILKQKLENFKAFKELNVKYLEPVEKLLNEHIPVLKEQLQDEMKKNDGDGLIIGGLFDNFNEAKANKKKGLEKTGRLSDPEAWPLDHKNNVNYEKYKAIFKNLKGNKKFVAIAKAAKTLSSGSPLTKENIKDIVNLSDCDGDGKLNEDEFTLAGFIVDFYTEKSRKSNKVIVIAKELPTFLIPKSKGGNRQNRNVVVDDDDDDNDEFEEDKNNGNVYGRMKKKNEEVSNLKKKNKRDRNVKNKVVVGSNPFDEENNTLRSEHPVDGNPFGDF